MTRPDPELDPRPFRDVLRDWRASHGWTWAQVAAELRAPLTTVRGWALNRPADREASLRRLMALIDRGSPG